MNYTFPLTQSMLERLDSLAFKHTFFSTFEQLTSPSNNYKPVLYYDIAQSESQRRDLEELAQAFDAYMKHTNDIRRIYRA